MLLKHHVCVVVVGGLFVCFSFGFSFPLHKELRNVFPFGSLSLSVFTVHTQENQSRSEVRTV